MTVKWKSKSSREKETTTQKGKRKSHQTKEEALASAFSAFSEKLNGIIEEGKEASREVLFEGIKQLRREYKEEFSSSRRILDVLHFIEREKETFIPATFERPPVPGKDYYDKLAKDLLRFGERSPITIWTIPKLCEVFLPFHPLKDIKCKDVTKAVSYLAEQRVIPEPVKTEHEILYVLSPIRLAETHRKILVHLTASRGAMKLEDLRLLLGMSEEELNVAVADMEEIGMIIIADEEIYLPTVYEE